MGFVWSVFGRAVSVAIYVWHPQPSVQARDDRIKRGPEGVVTKMPRGLGWAGAGGRAETWLRTLGWAGWRGPDLGWAGWRGWPGWAGDWAGPAGLGWAGWLEGWTGLWV